MVIPAFSIVVAISVASSVATVAPSRILAEVQRTYSHAGNISADFQQTYFDNLRGTQHTESGKLWAAKDGRVRWMYITPTRKDFVYDGKTAYFYEPENAQVTVIDKFGDTQLANAISFLIGKGNLEKLFDVKPCKKLCKQGDPGDIVVALWPKQTVPSVDHVLLAIDPKTHRVRTSVLFDPLGNRTEYRFSHVRFGVHIDPAMLQFTIPRGVQILRSTAADTQQPGTARSAHD